MFLKELIFSKINLEWSHKRFAVNVFQISQIRIINAYNVIKTKSIERNAYIKRNWISLIHKTHFLSKLSIFPVSIFSCYIINQSIFLFLYIWNYLRRWIINKLQISQIVVIGNQNTIGILIPCIFCVLNKCCKITCR